MGSNSTSAKTSYYLDMEAIRAAFSKERSIRGTALKDIEAWSGIETTRLSSFSTGGANLGADSLITLVMWMDMDIRKFIGKRARRTVKHKDTYDQKQLRVAEGFLEQMNLSKEPGESAVDAMIRILGTLKANGVNLEGQE